MKLFSPAIYALANDLANPPSEQWEYEAGTNGKTRSKLDAKTLDYFKPKSKRQEKDLKKALLLGSQYLKKLPTLIQLWAKSNLENMPKHRYKVAQRNSALVLEALAALAIEHSNTEILVTERNLATFVKAQFGIYISKKAARNALAFLHKNSIIDITPGKSHSYNGLATKVKLLKVEWVYGEHSFGTFGDYSLGINAVKKERRRRRSERNALRRAFADKMRGIELIIEEKFEERIRSRGLQNVLRLCYNG